MTMTDIDGGIYESIDEGRGNDANDNSNSNNQQKTTNNNSFLENWICLDEKKK